MRIRITNSRYWYRVGEVYTTFNDKPDRGDDYLVEHPYNTENTTYLVYGRDCEVINEEAEELANVTVLKDESIGGLEREYTEVKRKAAVGEKVRVFGHYSKEANGIFTVTKLEDGDIRYLTALGQYGTPYENGRNYVTLKPTGIVRIGNVRYRLVERNAAEGERVVFTESGWGITAGKVYSTYDCDEDGGEFKDDDGVTRWQTHITCASYVLEPLKSVPDIAAEDVSLLVLSRKINEHETLIDGLTDAVAKLTLQLKVAREDKVVGVGIYGKKADVIVIDDIKLTRDDIIAKAKRDVAELERQLQAYPYELPATKKQGTLRVKFVINRDKRTIVALTTWGTLRDQYGHKSLPKGIAKAAPGECFNVHIGRAIALRRALGLEVPAEYTQCPPPSEPRVGDIVFYSDMYPRLLVTENKTDITVNPQTVELPFLLTVSGTYVIDDSRTGEDEEVTE